MKKHSTVAGLPPGSLVLVGEQRVDRPSISVIDYNEESFQERSDVSVEECAVYPDSPTVSWVNFTGLHDMVLLERFGGIFGIHPLVLEDIVNTGQRPKMEDFGDYIFMSLKMLYRDVDTGLINAEHVGLILARNYVLSFQEVEGDVFDVIRDRLRTAKGRIRGMSSDYLAYSLLDAIIDNYFVVLEDVGDRIEELQNKVLKSAAPETVAEMQQLRRELVFMRKSLWPLRELVSGLEKLESPLIGEAMPPYLRDAYEHAIHVIDTVELLRDMLAGAMDIHMTVVSNRMNEIMKVLTVIATVFIPLTFIAGIYGMNFRIMPELGWRYGYPSVLALMVAVAVGMWIYFRRQRWL